MRHGEVISIDRSKPPLAELQEVVASRDPCAGSEDGLHRSAVPLWIAVIQRMGPVGSRAGMKRAMLVVDLDRLPTGMRHDEVSSIRITEAEPSELDEPVSEPDSINTRQGSGRAQSIHTSGCEHVPLL